MDKCAGDKSREENMHFPVSRVGFTQLIKHYQKKKKMKNFHAKDVLFGIIKHSGAFW